MERKKSFLTAFLIGWLAFTGWSGNNAVIYDAYVTGKMELWEKEMNRLQNTGNRESAFLLELVNYQYGYIGYCMGTGHKKEAREYLDLAEINLALLKQSGTALPIINAYRAAFYGFRIGLAPIQSANGERSQAGGRELELSQCDGFSYPGIRRNR